MGQFIQELAIDDKQDSDEGDSEPEDVLAMETDDVEDKYADLFLQRFLIGSESVFMDRIDLRLMLKAL